MLAAYAPLTMVVDPDGMQQFMCNAVVILQDGTCGRNNTQVVIVRIERSRLVAVLHGYSIGNSQFAVDAVRRKDRQSPIQILRWKRARLAKLRDQSYTVLI